MNSTGKRDFYEGRRYLKPRRLDNQLPVAKFDLLLQQLNRNLSNGNSLDPYELNDWVWRLVTTATTPNETVGFRDQSSSYPWIIDLIYKQLGAQDNNSPYFWKPLLWTYAAFLNRTKCPATDPMFTKVKSAFNLVLYSGNVKTPEDIAELDVIRHHFAIHLELKKGETDPTLELVGAELKMTYETFLEETVNKFNKPVDWETLVENLTSKTTFEDLYPPSGNYQQNRKSLFLVDGQPIPRTSLAVSYPRNHAGQSNNVMEVSTGSIFESCLRFVDEFFSCLDKPGMTPRLKRSMILALIDLMDIALIHGEPIERFLKYMRRKETTEEPKTILEHHLIMLWVYAGVKTNSCHHNNLQNTEILTEIIKWLEKSSSNTSVKVEKAEEIQDVKELCILSTNNSWDFHAFLKIFSKYYPRRKGPPVNDLEKKYLDLRIRFSLPQPFSLDLNLAKKPLCATTERHCPKKKSDNERCSACDSDSEHEEDGPHPKALIAQLENLKTLHPKKMFPCDCGLSFDRLDALMAHRRKCMEGRIFPGHASNTTVGGGEDDSISVPPTSSSAPQTENGTTTPEQVSSSTSAESKTRLYIHPLVLPPGFCLPPILDVFLTPHHPSESFMRTNKNPSATSVSQNDNHIQDAISEETSSPVSTNSFVAYSAVSNNQLQNLSSSSSSSATKLIKLTNLEENMETNEKKQSRISKMFRCQKPLSHVNFHADSQTNRSSSDEKGNSNKGPFVLVAEDVEITLMDDSNKEWEVPPNSVETLLPPDYTDGDYVESYFSPGFITQTIKIVEGVWHVVLYHEKMEAEDYAKVDEEGVN